MFYLNKIKTFFKKLPWLMAERALLSFLILLLISLILGGLIFYQYNILPKKKEVGAVENLLQFQEETYNNILMIWQERERRFKESDGKRYFDIFREIK